MSFLTSLENRIKQNFNIWDLAMIKWVGILFGLLVGAYYADFIKNNTTILVAILLLIGFWLAFKMLKKIKIINSN
ncbi:hypothetical protein [Polaribacter ponticola]|uniref:AtpZ/AtpI family protein n=1 Tax=Polaribacter ponticola TaxID=2978475 RepID=A0ABT5S6Y0_9FLAO|nr:hypothetical protein [Polaribacter sp. MSW5]MDD7913858.1 hypothetical protein [Polaribacter sp. MSW5]